MSAAILLLMIVPDYDIYFHLFHFRNTAVLTVKFIECKKQATLPAALLR